MPDAGETQIVRRMGRQVYVETRSGEPTGEETSIVPANGTGVHVNGAAAAPDPALKRREATLKERIRQLKEEIEAHKDDWVSKNFLRRESLANAESMLADLQAGKSRGFFTQLNDGVVALTDSVVDGGEAAIDGGVKLGSEAWGLGGEVVTGDFGAAGDRLGRGADAVKGAASDGYNAVVSEPWFQGTRDAWNTGQYGAATGGIAPEVAGVAAIVKGGAKRLLREVDDVETPPTPHNNAIKEEKPEKRPGDKEDPEKKGEPVLVTTGEYVETWDDFSLDGTIPVTLARSYGALWAIEGPFGRNRTSFLDMTFTVTPDNELLYRDERGRRVVFARPFNLSASTNPKYRHLSLRAPWLKKLELQNRRLTYFFEQGKDKVYRLHGIEDRDNNRITIKRDIAGLVLSAVHSDGYTLNFKNDARGLRVAISLESAEGPTQSLAHYEYDSAGNLVHADCETAFSIRYRYDDGNRLIAWCDISGRSETSFFYDAHSRVIRTETSGPWNNDRFVYDRENNITTYFPGGHTAFERFYYDADDNVLRQENALGELKSFDYEDGYRTSVTDGEGSRSAFSYDPFGNVSSYTDAEGRITLYRWGMRGELDLVIDHAGNAYRNEHDERGHVVSATDPTGAVTQFDWNANGRLVGVRFADGTQERRDYDKHHRLISITKPNGATTTLTRDHYGRIVAVSDPLGTVTRIVYDRVKGKPLDLATRIERPGGVVISREFDVEGQMASITDGEGRTTRYEYGPFDQLTALIDPCGGRQELSYNVEGDLLSVTNARGDSYEYRRDLAGRIIEEVDFEGRSIRYRRDKAGRIVTRIAPDHAERRYEYDKSGLLQRMAAHPVLHDGRVADVAAAIESFEYDARGLLVSATNGSAEVLFERDPVGRVIGESQNGRRVGSSFDAMGRRVRREIGFSAGWTASGKKPTGFRGITVEDIEAGHIVNPPDLEPPQKPAPDSITDYMYDPLGLLSELMLDLSADGTPRDTLTFRRDAIGRETGRTNSRGFSLDQGFDPLGQLIIQAISGRIDPVQGIASATVSMGSGLDAQEVPLGVSPGSLRSAKKYERHFAYDKALLPVSIDDDLWGQSNYAYDPNGQVTEAKHGQARGAEKSWLAATPPAAPLGLGDEATEVERFTYDAACNISANHTAFAGEPLGGPQVSWLTLSSGAVKAARGPSGERIILSHDDCGRVIERRMERNGFRSRVWRFAWDTFDRLVASETPDGERWLYSYDALNRRVEKRLVEARAEPGVRAPRQVGGTCFVWDGDTIAEEIPIASDGTLITGVSTVWHHEPNSFRPLARQKSSGEIHYVVTDHMGTPRELVSSTGSVDWAASYRLWGSVRQMWKRKPVAARLVANGEQRYASSQIEEGDGLCPIRFQGQWEDAETGLYYNRFRYYDPLTTGYLSPDPIGLDGGNRPNGYVDSPTMWIDPFGLADSPGTILYPLNPNVTPQAGSYSAGINRAWSLEQQLVRTTGGGTVNWAPAQMDELLNTGKVSGFTGHHINNAAQYPAWEGDPRNIRFLQNGREGLPNDHLYSDRGHRGNWQNETSGRLIDRQAMIDRHNREKANKKCDTKKP